MAAFDGARIEAHDELWGESLDNGQTSFGRTLSVWGLQADGGWLGHDDALCDLSSEDIEILVETDGSVTISHEGQNTVTKRLAEAFPGAEIHYFDDESVDEGELDVAGIPAIFEVEWLMGALADEQD